MAVPKKWLWNILYLLLAVGGFWFTTSPRFGSPVSRPVDAIAWGAILALVYLSNLLSFRGKLAFIAISILAYSVLFYYSADIAWHYLAFAFILVFNTAAMLFVYERRDISFLESVFRVRRMLRHEPSEEEERMLTRIRSNRH